MADTDLLVLFLFFLSLSFLSGPTSLVPPAVVYLYGSVRCLSSVEGPEPLQLTAQHPPVTTGPQPGVGTVSECGQRPAGS